MIMLNTKQLENLRICDGDREKARSKIKEIISKLDEDADLIILSDARSSSNTTDSYKVMGFVDLIFNVYFDTDKPGSVSKLLVFYLNIKIHIKEITMKEAFIKYDNIYSKYGEDMCKIDSSIIMSKLNEPNLTLMILIEQSSYDMSFVKTAMRLSDKKFNDHFAGLVSSIGEIIDTL